MPGWWCVQLSLSVSERIGSLPTLPLLNRDAFCLEAEAFHSVPIHMHISMPQKAFPFERWKDNHVFEMRRYSPATLEIFISSPRVREFNRLRYRGP